MSVGPTSPVQQQDIDRIEGKLDRIIKLLEMILKENKSQHTASFPLDVGHYGGQNED